MANLNADHLLAAVQMLACLYIAFRGLVSLNDMGPRTRTTMRLAYALITASAAYGVVNCLPQPDLFTTTLAAGVALFLYGDMRRSNHG